MAIVFNCPHCNFAYTLKDEYAGKKATCKGANCRKVITVPQPQPRPATVPPGDTPPPTPPIDIEAAALSALADDPVAAAGPQDIAMACDFCGHKWAEPVAKAGKNVLCPNPECRQRTKVPVPKDNAGVDWRTGGQRGPSLAKENFEKPTDVQDAGDAKIVSREALKATGATNEEFEPVPLKRKLMFILPPVLLLAGLVGGIWYYVGMRKENKQNQLMADALKEWDEKVDEGSRPPPAQVLLFPALLHTLAGEHTLRDVDNHNDPKKHLAKAVAEYTQAREQLRQSALKDADRSAAGERNVLLAELAAATLLLGGTDDQVKNETRVRWLPEAPGGRQQRVNEKTVTVHAELVRTLDLLRAAEFDFKADVARRLTRELARRGQAGMAADGLHTMLFDPAEQPEARAVIALELYRLDRGSDLPRKIGDELKQATLAKNLYPFPASATTLWRVLGTEGPNMVGEPPSGVPSDNSCLAYTGVYLLQDKPDDAVQLALRAGRPETRLRALALCADWLPDPGRAADEAAGLVTALAKKKEGGLPQASVLRLVQRAAEAGKAEPAKALADGLTDDGLRVWAKSEVVAARVRSASPKEAAEPVEVPDDARALRVGHAWGRMWVARQGARMSGSRDTKVATGWPAAVHPFGLAGVALGLQDRDAAK